VSSGHPQREGELCFGPAASSRAAAAATPCLQPRLTGSRLTQHPLTTVRSDAAPWCRRVGQKHDPQADEAHPPGVRLPAGSHDLSAARRAAHGPVADPLSSRDPAAPCRRRSYNSEERESYKEIIFSNTVQSMRSVASLRRVCSALPRLTPLSATGLPLACSSTPFK